MDVETRLPTFDVEITLKNGAGRHLFRAREVDGGRVQFEHDYRVSKIGSELMDIRAGGGGLVSGAGGEIGSRGGGWEARFARMFDLLHDLSILYKEKVADGAWHTTYYSHRCTRIRNILVELAKLEQDPRAHLYYQVWAERMRAYGTEGGVPPRLCLPPSRSQRMFVAFKVGYKAGWKLDGEFKARLAVATLLVPDRPCLVCRAISTDMAHVLLGFLARES